MSGFFLGFIIFIVHDQTPVDRFDRCLKTTSLFFTNILMLKYMIHEHVLVSLINVTKGLFSIFLDKINLCLLPQILSFFSFIFSEIIDKVMTWSFFLFCNVYFLCFMLGVKWYCMVVHLLMRAESWILDFIEMKHLLNVPGIDIFLLNFQFGVMFHMHWYFIFYIRCQSILR